MFSKNLYWILLGFSAMKVYSCIVMLVWAFNDSTKTRMWLTSAQMVNFASSAMSFSFGMWAVYISPDVFFPNGMTSGGRWFNFKVAFAGFFPALIFLYLWSVARRFSRMKAP